MKDEKKDFREEEFDQPNLASDRDITLAGETKNKLKFSIAMYDRMMEELLADEPKFDTMSEIVEQTLKKYVEYLCRGVPEFRGSLYHEDLMQEIHIKVFNEVIDGFVKKNPDVPQYNPFGFSAWLHTVANNMFYDALEKKNRKNRLSVLEEEKSNLNLIESPYGSPDENIRVEILQGLANDFLEIAMALKTNAPKRLTWIAEYVWKLGSLETRIAIRNGMVEKYSDMTLSEMYMSIFREASEEFPWLKLENYRKEIEASLSEKFRDTTKTYGETLYKDTFMTKGPTQTVSDWMNRMNEQVSVIFNREESDKNKKSNNKKPNTEKLNSENMNTENKHNDPNSSNNPAADCCEKE